MNGNNLKRRKSRGQVRKDSFRDILGSRDFEALEKWARSERMAVRTVSSLLFDPDELTCWRAAEALGKVAAVAGKNDEEKVRQLLRRLFWQMNDESGNLGWYAPQAIAEIIVNIPHLAYEYTPILVSYLVEEPFEKGVRLGLVRINEVNPDAVKFTPAIEIMVKTFDRHDEDIRACTIYTLAKLGARVAPSIAKTYLDSRLRVKVYNYHTGELQQIPVSEFARDLLNK